MTTTYAEATGEIYQLFKTKWDSESAAIAGYVPEVRYANNEKREKPESGKFWVRISVQSVDGEQSTISDCVDAPGKRHFTDYGLIFVQVFCPKSVANSDKLGRKLAEVARNAYRKVSTPGGVWFRNSRIQDIPAEELFYRFNVVAEYEYDEVY